jgi:shikimate kinase
LEELALLRRHVVATGGGIVLAESNRRRLKEAGRVVWLTAGVETLWQRMQQDPTTAGRRPDLTVGGLREVEELLRAREPLYRECAEMVVATEGRTPDAIAEEILTALPGPWKQSP